ncbi:MAG: arsenate reductase ArsC [Nitrospira sp.]|nr:arsenate reductase ArsC [Nitrospira sp.]
MKPAVLFLCTGNSCRSQMAEGWLRHLAGSRFEAVSAGTNPVGVNPRAVEVMGEVGIDLSRHRSKHVAEFQGQHLHYVITVCDHAHASCPADPRGDAQLHWSFDDPADAQGSNADRLQVFRRVRDEIAERIRRWLNTTAPSSESDSKSLPEVKDRRRRR